MGTMTSDVQAIVDHASKRYEDSLICDALRYFITFAGDVPRFAWGEMEWSARWAADWTSAVGCRKQEAGIARDVQGETGANLYRVAADYTHTDISSAVEFKDIASQNNFFAPWLSATASPGTVTTSPGRLPAGPTYFSGTVHPTFPSVALTDPNDLQVRVALAREDHGLNGYWIENVGQTLPIDRALAVLGNSTGRNALLTFVNKSGSAINQAEKIIEALGLTEGRLPMQDFIQQALTAYPQVIINRAELLNAVGNEWASEAQL